jgi:hypothetical protein
MLARASVVYLLNLMKYPMAIPRVSISPEKYWDVNCSIRRKTDHPRSS